MIVNLPWSGPSWGHLSPSVQPEHFHRQLGTENRKQEEHNNNLHQEGIVFSVTFQGLHETWFSKWGPGTIWDALKHNYWKYYFLCVPNPHLKHLLSDHGPCDVTMQKFRHKWLCDVMNVIRAVTIQVKDYWIVWELKLNNWSQVSNIDLFHRLLPCPAHNTNWSRDNAVHNTTHAHSEHPGRKNIAGQFATIPLLKSMVFVSKFIHLMIRWHVTLWWETCLMSAYKSMRSSSDPFLWGIFDSRNRWVQLDYQLTSD